MEKTANALRKNNMSAVCVDSIEELPDILCELIGENDTVAVGGSMTLFEAGVIDFLRFGEYAFLDRYKEGLTKNEVGEIYRKSFYADSYLCSANAITEDGELFCVDGNGNRVAAMIFGPKSVIVIAGFNKIVKNLDEAKERVKRIAAPANAKRLKLDTPCSKAGFCHDCACDDRICAAEVTLTRQRTAERIKVILVGEELGY